MPTKRAACARAAPSVRRRATRSAYTTLPNTVFHGSSWSNSWKTTTRSGPGRAMGRPASSIDPLAGGRKPATDLSSVDLPQPEGPSSTNFSPSRTVNETDSTAVKSPCSVSYEIVTSRTIRRSGTASAAGQSVQVLEGVVLPRRGHGLDHADLLHERSEPHEAGRRQGVRDAVLLHDGQDLVGARLRFLGGRVEPRGVGGPGVDERRRLLQRVDEGVRQLRVGFHPLVARPHEVERVGAARGLVGIEDLVDRRVAELLVLVGRRAEVARDLAPGQDGRR